MVVLEMGASMTTKVWGAEEAHIPLCGKIMYEAFKGIAEQHNFPPDIPSAEVAGRLLTELMNAPGFDAFVAEEDGQIIGSIFVSRRSPVGGISVLTIDPKAQNRSVGRRLMRHGMKALAESGHARQQLVQAGYHNRSLCLYAKLGFVASEMLSNMTGDPVQADFPTHSVRPAINGDAERCNALSRTVHGFDRPGELARAIEQGTAMVVERDDRITGYTTGIGFVGHGVGETNDDLKALIASTDTFVGPGILIPTANGELFRWCLENGLRVVQQMILMDTSPSGSPNGAYWPSVLC
jgi:predicted N-acetyltransferase YhbS